MPCTAPVTGYRTARGTITSNLKGGYYDRTIQIRCGQCKSCRIDKAAEWTTRILHELQTTREKCSACKARALLHTCGSSFITLTYSNETLPLDAGLDLRHWQLFAKRLRKNVGRFRYYMCGEYGTLNKRPHYHAILFGIDFSEDRIPIGTNAQGDTKYYSAILEKLWELGRCEVGTATRESANYVARYLLDKKTGPQADKAYERTNGKLTWHVNPEFATMSLKPGIGTDFYNKYTADIHPSDNVVVNGQRVRTPKYYDKLLKERSLTEYEILQLKRRQHAAKSSPEDNENRREHTHRYLNALARQKREL